MKKFRKWILYGAALALTVAATSAVQTRLIARDEPYDQLKTLAECLTLIQADYVDADKTHSKDLLDGAIKGMVGTLDPYSSYLDTSSYKEMQDETKGSFGGLGIEIAIKNNQLTVVSPIDGTPAFRAGIKAGDAILKINGESTDSIQLTDAVHKMRGPKGTQVTITVMRDELKAPKDYTITRDNIKFILVRSNELDGGVGYIQLTSFMGESGDEFKAAMTKLRQRHVRGLIVDLRNNPGGLLNMAAAIAENFVPKGQLIVYTDGRIKGQNMRFVSEAGETWSGPLAVLINGGSASASEILAGAIQDHSLGVLVGTKSFGKGSVQTIMPLSGGSALRLTTAKYLTPLGRTIHGKGITPDILVEEDVPSSQFSEMAGQDLFSQFVKSYAAQNPNFSLTSTAQSDEEIKVSEHSWDRLKPESAESKVLRAYEKYSEDKVKQFSENQFAVDHDRLLLELKKEWVRRSQGEDEARKVALEGDPQVRRALDALKLARFYGVKNTD
jgi:carboxyl-terminal processing protease